jgi:hypothetical protein
MIADPRLLRRMRTGGTIAAVAGFSGLALGVWLDPERTCLAYLAAWTYAISIALGALAIVMIAHTTEARWFVIVRRVAETIAGTIPVLAILFLPLFAGLAHLYPWARSTDALAAAAKDAVHHRSGYLNEPFFVARSVGYLVVWSALAIRLRRWSLRQDATGEAGPLLLFSGIGLFVFGFTVTFAAFDWLMSLSAEFSSTAFGLYFFAGAMVSSLAALVLLAFVLERTGALEGKLADSHMHALGRLMLTFVVFWAYIAYAQAFLVWIADVPREARWYVERWEHGWKLVVAVLVVGNFAIPFGALLSRPFKRSHRAMTALAVWLLVMHYVDVFWLIVPSLAGGAGLAFAALGAGSLAAIAGVVAIVTGRELAGAPVYPAADPDLAASLAYESR